MPGAATADALAPGFVSVAIVVSISDFLAGPGYGLEASAPWGIDVFGIMRHPVQIYEIIAALLALGAWRISVGRKQYDGQPFLVTLAVFAGGRLFVDAYRANAWLTDNGFHIIQLISFVVVMACLILLARQDSAFSRGNVEALEE